MTTIDVSKMVSEHARKIVAEITKSNGELYSTKPKRASGDAKYVWRMVSFYVSKNPAHHCMPVCADFDITDEELKASGFTSRINYTRGKLDSIVDEITNSIPKEQWFGVKRWARAFGV